MRRTIRAILSYSIVTVLCLATAALWARSWRSAECVSRDVSLLPAGAFSRGGNQVSSLEIFSMHGGVDVRYFWYPVPPAGSTQAEWSHSSVSSPVRFSERPARPTLPNRLGFYWDSGVPHGSYFPALGPGRTGSYLLIGFPYWLVMAIAALIAVRATMTLRRERKNCPPELCRSCGYDLRFSSERCPECGTVIPIISSLN